MSSALAVQYAEFICLLQASFRVKLQASKPSRFSFFLLLTLKSHGLSLRPPAGGTNRLGPSPVLSSDMSIEAPAVSYSCVACRTDILKGGGRAEEDGGVAVSAQPVAWVDV